MLLSWNAPPASDTSCPAATYTITIKPATSFLDPVVINTNDSATGWMVSDLMQGLEYYFIVAGVDAGGRVGDNSTICYISNCKFGEVCQKRFYCVTCTISKVPNFFLAYSENEIYHKHKTKYFDKQGLKSIC